MCVCMYICMYMTPLELNPMHKLPVMPFRCRFLCLSVCPSVCLPNKKPAKKQKQSMSIDAIFIRRIWILVLLPRLLWPFWRIGARTERACNASSNTQCAFIYIYIHEHIYAPRNFDHLLRGRGFIVCQYPGTEWWVETGDTDRCREKHPQLILSICISRLSCLWCFPPKKNRSWHKCEHTPQYHAPLSQRPMSLLIGPGHRHE